MVVLRLYAIVVHPGEFNLGNYLTVQVQPESLPSLQEKLAQRQIGFWSYTMLVCGGGGGGIHYNGGGDGCLQCNSGAPW